MSIFATQQQRSASFNITKQELIYDAPKLKQVFEYNALESLLMLRIEIFPSKILSVEEQSYRIEFCMHIHFHLKITLHTISSTIDKMKVSLQLVRFHVF